MTSDFAIQITETLQRVVTVNANSEDEAWDMVQELYKKEEIVLDASDYIDTEIEPFQNALNRSTFSDTDIEKSKLINEVIDYLEREEQRHYEAYDEKPADHLYLILMRLKELNV